MPLQSFIYQNFKGLNRSSDRLSSSPEFLYDLLNGYIKKDAKAVQGIILQRDGSSKVNSASLSTADYGTTTKIRTVYEVKWDNGGTDLVIRAGTAWGKYDNSDSFDTIDGGRGLDVIGQCAMFKNELIMVDGGVPRKMTAAGAVSALSVDANMPQDSDAVWVHRDKVWLNSAANPMIAYFCTTNSANGATSWTGAVDAGSIDLRTLLPVGDRIRGFRSLGGVDSAYLAIICDQFTVIYAAGANLYTFTFVQYFPTNCISIHAADYVGADLVYPTRNSLTSLMASTKNQQLEVNTLSTYIENLYRDLRDSTSDLTQISGVFCHNLNHYYINFPVASNHQILVYSVDVGNFVGRWTFPFNIYAMEEKKNGNIVVGSDGFVYKINDTTTAKDAGTGVSFKLSMPSLYFKDPSRYKKPIEFEALVQATSNLTFNIDYWYGVAALANDLITKGISISSGSSFWDVALWDVSYWDTQGNQIVKTADLLGRGKLMNIDIRHNTSGSKISIPWFALRVAMEGYN